MKLLLLAALLVIVATLYAGDPHVASAVDYNGVRALVALLID